MFDDPPSPTETYRTRFQAPTMTGAYPYTFRFTFDDGLTYTFCDRDGAGSNPGLDFSPAQLPIMTVP